MTTPIRKINIRWRDATRRAPSHFEIKFITGRRVTFTRRQLTLEGVAAMTRDWILKNWLPQIVGRLELQGPTQSGRFVARPSNIREVDRT